MNAVQDEVESYGHITLNCNSLSSANNMHTVKAQLESGIIVYVPFQKDIIGEVEDMELLVIGGCFYNMVGHHSSHSSRMQGACYKPVLGLPD